jgi:hypothetical protein
MRALCVWRCGLESADQGMTRSRMRAAIHDDFQASSGGQLLDDESRAQFNQRLRGVAAFSLSGQYTGKLLVTEGTFQEAHAALVFLWDRGDKMMAAATAGDVTG